MQYNLGLMWLRRDLRLTDNAALAAALGQCHRIVCAFVFDRAILDDLLADGANYDRRVDFIHRSVVALDTNLKQRGGALVIRHGDAANAIIELADELGVDAVFANADYEPYARLRDQRVKQGLLQHHRELLLIKDHVIFEKGEILTGGGTPFGVYTPYKNAWLKRVSKEDLVAHDTRTLATRLARLHPTPRIPTLRQIGFAATNLDDLPLPGGEAGAQQMFKDFKSRIDSYRQARDYPAARGPSYLSVHLRFGTISIRQVARFAHAHRRSVGAMTWLSELIWRDFYQMILWHHPHVAERAYRPQYDRIEWVTGPRPTAILRPGAWARRAIRWSMPQWLK